MKELTKRQLIRDHLQMPILVTCSIMFVLGFIASVVIPLTQLDGTNTKYVLRGMLLISCTIGIIFCGFFGLGGVLPIIWRCHAIRKGDYTIVYDSISRVQHLGVRHNLYMKKYSNDTGKIFGIGKEYNGRVHVGDGVYLIYIHGKAKRCKVFYLAHECKLSKEVTEHLI